MIGNNACGSRALGYGRTADNVVGLDVALGDRRGVRSRVGTPARSAPGCARSPTDHLAHVRTELRPVLAGR